jgi:hypothetical protein
MTASNAKTRGESVERGETASFNGRIGLSEPEVVRAYERYLAAFLADDLATIDSLVQYPLALVGYGKMPLVCCNRFTTRRCRNGIEPRRLGPVGGQGHRVRWRQIILIVGSFEQVRQVGEGEPCVVQGSDLLGSRHAQLCPPKHLLRQEVAMVARAVTGLVVQLVEHSECAMVARVRAAQLIEDLAIQCRP